jgi:hypothetical protein
MVTVAVALAFALPGKLLVRRIALLPLSLAKLHKKGLLNFRSPFQDTRAGSRP